MTIAELIPIAIQVSLALIVLCVGLEARLHDLTYLLRHPRLLGRSLLAMNVVMPLFAVALVVLFDLNPTLEIVLVATALAPVPPFLPKKEIQAEGEPSYVVGLLAIAALVAIPYVPAATRFLGWAFDRTAHVSVGAVARIIAMMFVPLVLGALIRKLAPAVARKIMKPASILGAVLLVVAFVPVLISEWRSMLALVGDYTIVAIVAFVLVGLAVGHLLGGPKPGNRTVLALSTATRHPAVVMAIAHDVQDKRAVLAAVLLVAIVCTIVSIPYVKWRRSAHDESGPRTRPTAS